MSEQHAPEAPSYEDCQRIIEAAPIVRQVDTVHATLNNHNYAMHVTTLRPYALHIVGKGRNPQLYPITPDAALIDSLPSQIEAQENPNERTFCLTVSEIQEISGTTHMEIFCSTAQHHTLLRGTMVENGMSVNEAGKTGIDGHSIEVPLSDGTSREVHATFNAVYRYENGDAVRSYRPMIWGGLSSNDPPEVRQAALQKLETISQAIDTCLPQVAFEATDHQQQFIGDFLFVGR